MAISLDYRVFKLRTDYPKQIESLEGFFARQLTFQGWLLFSDFTTWRICETDFCSCIKITTLLMLQHLFVQYNTFHLCTCKGNNCDTFICIVQKIQCLLSNKHVYYVQNIYWISTQWFCLFCDLEWILFIFCCVTSRFVSPLFCVNQVTKFGSE